MPHIYSTSLEMILLLSEGGLFLTQLFFLFFLYNRLLHTTPNACTDSRDNIYPPISIILVTKDYGKILEKNLTTILKQDYPAFEVIVINDKSAGEDENILKRLHNQYNNLYYSFIPETARYISRKKLGIAMGIRASHNEWLIITEPNYAPTSNQWLKCMAKHFTQDTDIVLGYSNYLPTNHLFSRWITTDALFYHTRFLSMALAGHPYMGIGKNLAYRKSLYEKNNGFHNHLQLLLGEDDLFINSVSNKNNTKIAIESDSIVLSSEPTTPHRWKEEKIGRMITGQYYQGKARIVNTIESWSCAMFHLSAITCISIGILQHEWIIVGTAFLFALIRLILIINIFRKIAHNFKQRKGLSIFFFDLLRPLQSLWLQISFALCDKKEYYRR